MLPLWEESRGLYKVRNKGVSILISSSCIVSKTVIGWHQELSNWVCKFGGEVAFFLRYNYKEKGVVRVNTRHRMYLAQSQRKISVNCSSWRVQFSSVAQSFVTPWTAAHQVSLSITSSQSLLKLRSIESVMPSSSVIPFSSCLQSFLASGSFQMSQFFTSGGQRLEFQLQRQSFQWIFRTDLL